VKPIDSTDAPRPATLFAYGFRPFFLVTLIYGLSAIVAWLFIRAEGGNPLLNLPPQLWHAHEMVFGFIVAAIAGFLLTAVPSWTNTSALTGGRLAALWVLWIAGRIVCVAAGLVPAELLALVELAFLPCLAMAIAPALVRARNRNVFVLGILTLLWLADAVFLRALSLGDSILASRAIHTSVDLVLLLVTIVAGRIVPVFTANALRQRGITLHMRSSVWVESLVILSMLALVLLEATGSTNARLIATTAGLAAGAHIIRLSGWHGHRTWGQPLVWVLHLAYAWLPFGLALEAIYLTTQVDWASQWFHALAVGAAGMMIVAVTTRAALGHTGRPLIAPRAVTAAYLTIAVATLVRACATPLLGHERAIWISGVLWIIAFGLLLACYAPILTQARADGRTG
jgi:uncharacterized protein involved in response to NO